MRFFSFSNQDLELERTDEALEHCAEAFRTPLIKNGQRRRLERLKRQIHSKIGPQIDDAFRDELEIEELNLVEEFELAKETKKAREMPALYEVAAERLKETGRFSHVLKGQESLFSCLFFGLFFEQIYSPQPGVFRFRLQKYPLDLETSAFIEHRRELFDRRFAELQQKDERKILEIIKEQRKNNQSLRLITKFSSIKLDNIKHLLVCLGKDTLLACLRRLSESYVDCRDGPNMILYNFNDMRPTENAVCFVECYDARNEPNEDHALWIEFLNSKNVPARLVPVKVAE